jgi:hypothetical protein
LPTRQLIRPTLDEFFHLDELEHRHDTIANFRARQTFLAQTETDVALDVHVREQRVGLEHHVHRPPMRRHVRDVDATDQHAARGRPFESGEQAKQRRFAATRAAEQRKTLAFGDVECDIVNRNDIVEAFSNACESNQWFVRYWPAFACVHARLRIRTKRGDFGATAISLSITPLAGNITGLSRTA